jgi:organic radical activating enzyme
VTSPIFIDPGTPKRSAERYFVHSIFTTVQGEGFHRGRKAVFIRFSGCNVWDGREESRSDKVSACALICDTEFRGQDETKGGGIYTLEELGRKALDAWGTDDDLLCPPFFVLTGGEPGLQVTQDLIETLLSVGDAAIETNGSWALPEHPRLWVCLSPKPPMPIHRRKCGYDEIKVLYPLYDPLPYEREPWITPGKGFPSCRPAQPLMHSPKLWVSPVDEAKGNPQHLNLSARVLVQQQENKRLAYEFVMKNPAWRVSTQLHKEIGVP